MSKAKCSVFFLCLFFVALSTSAQQVKATADSQEARPVYVYVEQMASQPVNLRDYFERNLNKALKDNVRGSVTVKFIVNEDGTTSDFVVVRGLSSECDEEAVRVLKSLPPWKPARQKGKIVRSYFTLPVVFKHP